jgi:hypothetical protein
MRNVWEEATEDYLKIIFCICMEKLQEKHKKLEIAGVRGEITTTPHLEKQKTCCACFQWCSTSTVGSALTTAEIVFPCNAQNRHQTACFKVVAKSYNVATRTAEPRRAKTAQNSQRNEASDAVLVTSSRAVRGMKSFGGLEACNLTATIAVSL